MQKDKGVGGFLNKKEGGQGALGIFALLSFLPTAEQGRGGDGSAPADSGGPELGGGRGWK